MSSPSQRQRRMFLGLLGAPLLAGLSGCGGGGADAGPAAAADTLRQPLGARQSVTRDDPPRRSTRPYERRGITAIVISADGSAIGVAHTDGRVLMLDSQGRETRMLKQRGSSVAVGLVFGADGRDLISIDRDSVAQGWNVETGERRFTLHGHEHGLRAIASNPSGTVVVAAGDSARVLAWDGSSGRLRKVLRGAGDFTNALSVSADGALISAGGADARVLVWETASGRLRLTLRGHTDEVSALSFSPDGRYIASAGDDARVLIWDVASGRQVQALSGQRSALRSLAFNADGSLLAGGGRSGQVLVWDSASLGVVQELTGSITAVNALAFARPQPNRLLAGNEDSQLLSWALPDRQGR
jgi:WD40 repeat protein